MAPVIERRRMISRPEGWGLSTLTREVMDRFCPDAMLSRATLSRVPIPAVAPLPCLSSRHTWQSVSNSIIPISLWDPLFSVIGFMMMCCAGASK